MVPRTDGMPFPTQAQVNPSLCVSCGICVGACPSSTPFRRTEDLRTGIDLPEYSLKELRERVLAVAGGLTGPGRVLVLACEHGAAGGRLEGTVVLPCVAMAPPSLIDFVLSRDLADGVAVAGCAESACYNRLGVKWTEERFAAQRDPYLRAACLASASPGSGPPRSRYDGRKRKSRPSLPASPACRRCGCARPCRRAPGQNPQRTASPPN
jgi:ferredoxin